MSLYSIYFIKYPFKEHLQNGNISFQNELEHPCLLVHADKREGVMYLYFAYGTSKFDKDYQVEFSTGDNHRSHKLPKKTKWIINANHILRLPIDEFKKDARLVGPLNCEKLKNQIISSINKKPIQNLLKKLAEDNINMLDEADWGDSQYWF